MISDQLTQFFAQNPDWRAVADYVAVPPTADELREEYPDADGEVLRRCGEPVRHSGITITRGTLYIKARRKNSERFAAAAALQAVPMCMTDDVFFAGMPTLAEQIGDERQLASLIKLAKSHGYTPGTHDVYQSGLARFRGDPEAFVSRSQGRHYIRRLCEQRGWACEGAVTVEHRQPEADPHDSSVPLAEDLIRSNARAMLNNDPSLARLDRRELREHVIQQHGPQSNQ